VHLSLRFGDRLTCIYKTHHRTPHTEQGTASPSTASRYDDGRGRAGLTEGKDRQIGASERRDRAAGSASAGRARVQLAKQSNHGGAGTPGCAPRGLGDRPAPWPPLLSVSGPKLRESRHFLNSLFG
ncbi:hypothetical protein LEMLEM_LOCUS25528, partial [Lemmus lemmus]